MNEKITIDMLTQDSVSIKKQNFTTVNGVDYPIGSPWRKAYVNSINGRQELQSEVAEPYLTSILGVWGSTPTVTENSPA